MDCLRGLRRTMKASTHKDLYPLNAHLLCCHHSKERFKSFFWKVKQDLCWIKCVGKIWIKLSFSREVLKIQYQCFTHVLMMNNTATLKQGCLADSIAVSLFVDNFVELEKYWIENNFFVCCVSLLCYPDLHWWLRANVVTLRATVCGLGVSGNWNSGWLWINSSTW